MKVPFFIILLTVAIYLHCTQLKTYNEKDDNPTFDTGAVWPVLRDTIPAVNEAGKLGAPGPLLDEAAQRRLLRR